MYPAVDMHMYVYYVHVNELFGRKSDFKENPNTCSHGLQCMNIALYLPVMSCFPMMNKYGIMAA